MELWTGEKEEIRGYICVSKYDFIEEGIQWKDEVENEDVIEKLEKIMTIWSCSSEKSSLA